MPRPPPPSVTVAPYVPGLSQPNTPQLRKRLIMDDRDSALPVSPQVALHKTGGDDSIAARLAERMSHNTDTFSLLVTPAVASVVKSDEVVFIASTLPDACSNKPVSSMHQCPSRGSGVFQSIT